MYGLSTIVGVFIGSMWDMAANNGVTVRMVGRIGQHLLHQVGILF